MVLNMKEKYEDIKWKIDPYPSSMKKEHMESVAHQQILAENTYRISRLAIKDINIEDKILWQRGAWHEYHKARAAYQKMLRMLKEGV